MEIKKIVIVGGGTAGWFTASALSKVFENVDISLIETSTIPTISVGESVTPHVQAFFDFLKIPTHDWMNETGAIYKFANKFQGWVTGDPTEVEYFSFTYPTDISRLLLETPEITNLDELKVNQGTYKTTDAMSFLFNKKSVDKFDKFFNSQYHYMVKNKAPFNGNEYLLNPIYSWSQHINVDKCATYVKNHIAIPNGVTHLQKKVVDVSVEQGEIKSLTLEDGAVIIADLFVDATGFHKLLVNKLGWKEKIYQDYAIDRAVVGQLSYNDPYSEMVNYTQSIAQPYGWQFKIGLYHRMGSGYCFSSSHLSDEKAIEQFLSITSNRRTEPRLIKWIPKRLTTFAEKNVATVGLCSGFYEPLEANSLFVLITGIKNLIESISDSSDKPFIDWTKYNNQLEYILDDISDFIKVHYTLSKRSDTVFWKDMRSIGERENHRDLLKSKYFDIRNSMIFANDHWSMFPDYMWMQLALSWGIDTSDWYPTLPDLETLNIAEHHFLTKEKKHDIISDYRPNNFEWLKTEIFQNLTSSEWEEKYK